MGNSFPLIDPDLRHRLERAVEFIDDRYDERIDLSAIASEACLSPYHFLRVFQNAYKLTPHEYLTARRLERAKELLASSGKSITEICFDVGFQSLGSFSTLFTKHVGISPSAFRAEYGRKTFVGIRLPQLTVQVPLCFVRFFAAPAARND